MALLAMAEDRPAQFGTGRLRFRVKHAHLPPERRFDFGRRVVWWWCGMVW